MKKKNFLVILLAITLSLSTIACGKETKDEGSKATAKKEISKATEKKEVPKTDVKKEAPKAEEKKEEAKPNTSNTENEASKNTPVKDNSNNVYKQDPPKTDSSNKIVMAGAGNKIPGVCQFLLGEVYPTPKIESSVINGNSSYYDGKAEGNIYIDVTLSMENLTGSAKPANQIISGRIKINNKEYSCFPLVESLDGSKLERNASIKGNESRRIHYVAEVPASVATGNVDVILTVNGKDFSGTVNLEDMLEWIEYKNQMGW